MARTVEDTAVLLEVLAGADHRDPLSVPLGDVDYLGVLERDGSDLSIAYSPDLDLQPVEPVVRETVGDAIEDLQTAGVTSI